MSYSFGAATTTSAGTFGTTTPSKGFSFGGGDAPKPMFGGTMTENKPFSFTSPTSSTPAFGASSGFAFAPKTTAATQGLFSSPTNTQAFGAAVPAFGGFSSPPNQTVGSPGFGQPAPNQNAAQNLSFGAPTQQPTAFGSPVQTQATTNLSFGSPAPGGMSFASPASTAPPAFGFTTPASGFSAAMQPQTSTTATAPQTSQSGFAFGSTSTTSNFGSTPTSSAMGGSSFGQLAPTFGQAKPGGFGFGGAATTTTPAFGSAATTTTPAFGAAVTAPAFGAPAANMPSTQQGFAPTLYPSLTFGAPTTAPPSFAAATAASSGATGLTGAPVTPSFGAPASSAAPTPTAAALGSTTATPTGFGFGAKPATSTGISFGTVQPRQATGQTGQAIGQTGQAIGQTGQAIGQTGQATGQAGQTMGQLGVQPSSGMSFGTPASQAGSTLSTAPKTSTPSFGTPASTGISFAPPSTTGSGTQPQTTSTGLSFGTSTGLSFGTATTAQPISSVQPTSKVATSSAALNFSAPASSATLNFGTTANSQATTGFQLGGQKAATNTGFSITSTASSLPSSTAAASSAPSGITALAKATTAATTMPALTTATTTTPSGPPQPVASINFAQLEESINKWTIELEEQERTFINQATQINAWDTLLIANGEKIVELNEAVTSVKNEQTSLEHELDFVLGQQRELEELLAPMEKLLQEQSGDRLRDPERDQMYSLAENLDSQLRQMSEDLKEVIEHLNETNRSQDSSDPIVQIGRILNAHMSSMQWVDNSIAQISTKLDHLKATHDTLRRDNERSFQLTYN